VQRAEEEGRADDDETTVRKRMEVYRTSTRPLIEFYEKRDLLARVNGVGDVDEVTERIQEVLS